MHSISTGFLLSGHLNICRVGEEIEPLVTENDFSWFCQTKYDSSLGCYYFWQRWINGQAVNETDIIETVVLTLYVFQETDLCG